MGAIFFNIFSRKTIVDKDELCTVFCVGVFEKHVVLFEVSVDEAEGMKFLQYFDLKFVL